MNQLVFVCLIVVASSMGASAFPNLFDLPKALLDKVPKVGSSFWLGRCPQTTELEAPFDVNAYLGDWFEIKRTGLLFEFGQRCVKANYKLDSNGNVAVNNSGVNLVDFEIFSLGTAKPASQSNVFGVTFFSLSPSAQYWVVDTDYKNYSLVVSCNDIQGFFNIKDAWILSRKPTLEKETLDRLESKLNSLGIPSFLLSSTKQNCVQK